MCHSNNNREREHDRWDWKGGLNFAGDIEHCDLLCGHHFSILDFQVLKLTLH